MYCVSTVVFSIESTGADWNWLYIPKQLYKFYYRLSNETKFTEGRQTDIQRNIEGVLT
jgi:hypothetical protein